MKKIVFLLAIFISAAAYTQKKAPKVGLVLSGGGAKGFAHIGVLKEIEKAGIKIDYIGGTSMGAIVGGLYASGYSAVQIEKMVKEIDFLSLLQDKLPRNALPFFEKEFGEKYAITLPVKNNKIGLPRGVSKGQNVLKLLTYLLTPVDSVSDFSKLPIPFFCIGTDVETGEQVIFEKGSLPLALRASGSFPTFLNPVEVDGKLIIDGGVVNNFPAAYMKSKDVDFIIGVDVQGKLAKKEKLTSLVSILNQIVSFQTYGKSDKQKKHVDVYIKPQIYEFTAADFGKKEAILQKGDTVAKKFREVFSRIADLQDVKAARREEIKIDEHKYLLRKIEVTGTKEYTRAYVLGKLNLQVGDSITHQELDTKIDFLTATNNYDKIEYRLNKKENALYIHLVEQNDKANIRLGAHYDQLYETGILLDYTNKSLLIRNDQLSVDLVLGDKIRYNLDYFVDNGFYVSYGFRSRYNQFSTNTKFSLQGNQNLNKINLNYSDFTNAAFVQTTFGRKFAMGGGVELKQIEIKTETVGSGNSSSLIVFDNSSYFNIMGYLKLDSYDRSSFPTRGFYADLGFKWYAWSSDYNNDFQQFQQLKGTLGFATTFLKNVTFQYTNEAGFAFNSPASDIFDFYLGGYNKNYINTFSSLYGYEFADISGNTFLKSEFEFRYQFFKNNYAVVIANYARVDNNVFADGNLFDDVFSGYAVGYGLRTFLGPIELKYSWSPDTKNHFWLFNLGFWF